MVGSLAIEAHALALAAPAPAANAQASQAWAAAGIMLIGMGIMEFLFKKRHERSLWFVIVLVILGLGASGAIMGALHWNWMLRFSGWLVGLLHLPTTSSLGGLIAVALAIVFRRTNIPLIPEIVERGLTAVIYFAGGALMLASQPWQAFYNDLGGLILQILGIFVALASLLGAFVNLLIGAIGKTVNFPHFTVGG
jgi:hypothetical protein